VYAEQFIGSASVEKRETLGLSNKTAWKTDFGVINRLSHDKRIENLLRSKINSPSYRDW
jgi:hypothetical protein